MNLKVELLWVLLISILCLIGFIGMAIVVRNQETIKTFDSVIINFIQDLETPVLTVIMKFFTEIGSTKIIVLIGSFTIIVLFIVLKLRSELVLITIVYFVARNLNEFLKEVYQRERPDFNRLIEVGGYSFPSGHAMNAIAFYGLLTVLLWRHIPSQWGRTILLLLSSVIILMIGISRIYLGVHYPSDVIGGYLASGFFIALTIWFYKYYRNWREGRRGPSKRGRLI